MAVGGNGRAEAVKKLTLTEVGFSRGLTPVAGKFSPAHLFELRHPGAAARFFALPFMFLSLLGRFRLPGGPTWASGSAGSTAERCTSGMPTRLPGPLSPTRAAEIAATPAWL